MYIQWAAGALRCRSFLSTKRQMYVSQHSRRTHTMSPVATRLLRCHTIPVLASAAASLNDSKLREAPAPRLFFISSTVVVQPMVMQTRAANRFRATLGSMWMYGRA